MTFFGASDLPALLVDSGVPIVWGVVTGKGIVDRVDRELIGDGSIGFTGKEIMVTLETERFAGLKEAEILFVEGAGHRVLQTRQVGDGALTEALLVPVAGAEPSPLRIPKGSDGRWDNALGPAPRVNGVLLATGSTLVVGVVTNGGSGPGRGASSVSWGATPLTKRGERNFGFRGVVQFWTLSNASGGVADLVPVIPVANGISGAILVVEVQNAAAASFDQVWSAAGNSTEPAVSPGTPITHANSILLACVGQEGESGPPGGWGNSFQQGHYDATPGGGDNDCTINGAWKAVGSTGIYPVSNPGRPAQPWGILLMAIRGN